MQTDNEVGRAYALAKDCGVLMPENAAIGSGRVKWTRSNSTALVARHKQMACRHQ
jgi:hypothetical protein